MNLSAQFGKSILQTIPKKERKLDYLLICWVWAVIALMSI